MSNMLKKLLRRFGYYKLNQEDRYALAKHYAPQMVQVISQKKRKYLSEYLGLDEFNIIMLLNPTSKIRTSYTCGQHEDVV